MLQIRSNEDMQLLRSIEIAALVGVLMMLPTSSAKADHFVIRNAQVFDGHHMIGTPDVWVEEGKIKGVGHNLEVPADVEEVEGAGATLLPGLIDAHTHAWGDALKDALAFGVTTELDMFTDINYVRQVKQLEAAGGARDQADLRSAGILATVRGGHGTEYGMQIPTLSTPAEAKGWVNARLREGSDYIKIVYDDGRAYGMEFPTLSKETMKALVDAAHEQGKLAIVHIGSQQQAQDAIEVGADGLAHLFADSPPTAKFASFAAAHHVFVVPTLSVLENACGKSEGESLADDSRVVMFLTAANVGNLKKRFPAVGSPLNEKYAEQTVRELKQAGVAILAGTDAPNPGTAHGVSLHRELELLVRAGMSPVEALAAATTVPAAVFHLEDRGEIVRGKRADLVLVRGDPTHDITATRDIVAVWKVGMRVDRAAFRAEIERAKRDAELAQAADSKTPGEVQGVSSQGIVISDFEGKQPTATFGAGWSVSTDSIMGGKSTGRMAAIGGGANGSKYALKMSGNVDGGLLFAWAGAMFSPGARLLGPANLSAKKELIFWAKGDGKPYRVMVLTTSGGRIPAQQSFNSEREWKRYTMPLSAFNGTDGHDVTAIMFVGGPAAGEFELVLDEIGLR